MTAIASPMPVALPRTSASSYARDAYRWLVNPYGFLDDARRRYGPTFRVRLPVLGRVLMTGDPAAIAQMVHHPDLDAGKAISALRAVLGDQSLIMLDQSAHAARCRLVAPCLRGPELSAYDNFAATAVHQVMGRIPPGRTFAALDVLRRCSLKAMVRAMFGCGASAQQDDELGERLVEQFLNSFRNPLFLFLAPLRVDLGRLSPWGRAMRNRARLCEWIAQRIRTGAGEQSILGRFVAAAKGAERGLDEATVVAEVLALLLFGHDTPATTMAWALAHIYQQPSTAERLRDEAAGCRATGAIDPLGLPFLRACLQESMRLSPVVVHVTRRARQDTTVAGHAIREGEHVIPCTYLSQHDPQVFPAPEDFSPERFLSGRTYEHSFFPFGLGRRTCVGMPLAMRQMLVILGTLIGRYELELSPGYRPRPVRQLVLIGPSRGTPMQLCQRRMYGPSRANGTASAEVRQ